MKYPAIIKNGLQVVLAFNESSATHIEGEFVGVSSDNYYVNTICKNITHEYLSNTWGVVESKERAEFIIELAELHGFECGVYDGSRDKFFYCDEDYLGFISSAEIASNRGEKQITIPLPPKAKEWAPEVGSEVLFTPNPSINYKSLCKVSFIGSKHIILTDRKGKEYSRRIAKAIIEKPKTEQDLKIEELQTKLCDLNAVDNYILASEIVMGNVEGLSYE